MNKIELTSQFIQQHLNQFQCPVCQGAFITAETGTVVCENQHTFNVAKKGSLFFLSHPVKTEYTDEMLRYRHQFLTAGFFDPMLARVQEALAGGLILDAGCGEGTTTKWLANHSKGSLVGLDISKPAINIASAGIALENQPLFMVGDLARLPLADHRLDAIVNILSPANYQEFDRALAPDGILVKVIPGNHYLQELRHLVYPDGQHATYDNAPVKNHFIERYPQAEFTTVKYEFALDQPLFTALFNMTPLTWQAQENREQLLQRPLDSITAEFEIAVVRRS